MKMTHVLSGLFSLTCCDAGAGAGARVVSSSAAGSGEREQGQAYPACSWSVEPCEKRTYSWQASVLLRASDFGADAHFIAIGGQAIGIAGSVSEPKRVARFYTEIEADRFGVPYRVYPLPTPELDLIDVVDGEIEDEQIRVYALACRASTSCSLWQVSADAADGAALQELPGSELTTAPTALIFDAYLKQPCVLAQGLRCFDGTWHEEISDSDVRDVAAEETVSFAVGTHGKSWLRERAENSGSAAWVAQPVDAAADWTIAAVSGKERFAIGEHGVFKTQVGSESTVCTYPEELAATAGRVLATKQGELLYNQYEGKRCPIQRLDVGEILDGSLTYCLGGENSWFMTRDTIIGSNSCALYRE